MNYSKPDANVVRYDNQDIITKSGNCGHKTSGHGGTGCANKGHSNEHSWGKGNGKKGYKTLGLNH